MLSKESSGTFNEELTIIIETNSRGVIEEEMCRRLAEEERGNEAAGETRECRHCTGELRDFWSLEFVKEDSDAVGVGSEFNGQREERRRGGRAKERREEEAQR